MPIAIGPEDHLDLRLDLALAMDVTIHEVFAAVENTVFCGKAGAETLVAVCWLPPGITECRRC